MSRYRRNPYPMRTVVEAHAHEGAGALLADFRITIRWWELRLECGHEVERSARFEKGATEGRQGWAALHHPAPFDKMLPPPKRVRCERCPIKND